MLDIDPLLSFEEEFVLSNVSKCIYFGHISFNGNWL